MCSVYAWNMHACMHVYRCLDWFVISSVCVCHPHMCETRIMEWPLSKHVPLSVRPPLPPFPLSPVGQVRDICGAANGYSDAPTPMESQHPYFWLTMLRCCCKTTGEDSSLPLYLLHSLTRSLAPSLISNGNIRPISISADIRISAQPTGRALIISS